MKTAKPKPKPAAGIVCPVCGATMKRIRRTTKTTPGIRRRRECQCGARLTTRELPIGSVSAHTSATCIGQIQKSLNLSRDLSLPIPTESKH